VEDATTLSWSSAAVSEWVGWPLTGEWAPVRRFLSNYFDLLLKYTVLQKNMWPHFFLSVYKAFGTRITKSIGHRQVFSVSHLTCLIQLLYLAKLSIPKNLSFFHWLEVSPLQHWSHYRVTVWAAVRVGAWRCSSVLFVCQPVCRQNRYQKRDFPKEKLSNLELVSIDEQ